MQRTAIFHISKAVKPAIKFDLQSALSEFGSYVGVGDCGSVTEAGPDILKFSPQHKKSAKKIKIGLMALVHGNEIIGLPILNTLLNGLVSGLIQTEHEIIFGLGNLPAANADRRFLENDLNRSFGLAAEQTAEDLRAREIEKYLLDEVDYLIDLHQTIQHTLTPFFIFQFSSKNCLSHVSLMNSRFPTILQFDTIGETQGLSSDEYLRGRGRFGVALELGQIGLTPEKFDVGVATCARFIEKLNRFDTFEQLNVPFSGKIEFPLFEINERMLAPDNNSRLDSTLSNFAKFSKGQVIGSSDSGPILASSEGSVLFPRLNQSVAKGQHLFFTCTEMITVSKPPAHPTYIAPEIQL